IALDRANTAVADTAISWRLLRLERQWQWYKRGGSWRYEAAVIPNEADAGEIRTDASGTAQLALTPKWGQYRIELTRSTGSGDTPIRTTYKFASGWVQSADADSPEVLDVAVDRARFAPGETATVRVTTRKGGRATVAILGNGLHAMKTVEIASGDTEIPITVGRDWGAGAYAAVMLHLPMDTKARRMPTRALGLVWIGRDTSDRTLKVALEAPKQMRSARTLNVPIAITGAAPGERTHVTIAAVDVGILNVTRFKAPTPANRFGAQTQLGAEIRDVYGRLIDGMTAERGTMRAGGDADASLKLDAAPPMWKTVAKFSGIVTTDADGRANVSFDMPEFAGTVKLMAVAWTDTKTGSAAQDVIVRDPITLSVATPRFMTLGDTAELTLDVHNVDAPAGDFDVSLSAVQQDGPVRALLQKRVSFKSDERRTVRIPVIAERMGTMELIARARAVTAAAPNQEPTTVTRKLSVTVNAGGDDISRTRRVTLKPGGSLTIDSDQLFGLVRPTAQLTIDVGAAPGLNVPALLTSLDRYPYGCTEQTITRALPLLYANAIGLSRGQQPDTNLRRRITDAVQRVLARQDSSGAFGL
ncbi:MAG: alpha-2-macroglobulin family protein, partial [Pseudomonadota bacterium]